MRRGNGVGAAVVLALVAGGCSGGTERAEEVRTVERLDAVAAGTTSGSARIDYRLRSTREGTRVDASGSALVDFDRQVSNLRVDLETRPTLPARAVDEGAGPVVFHSETRTIGGRTWTRYWLGDAASDSWVAEPSVEGSEPTPTGEGSSADGTGELRAMLDDPMAFDPERFLAVATKAAISVREVGPETVRGIATTRYRADFETGALGEDHGSASGGADRLDVWVDGDHRARRIEAGSMSIELSDFGVDVALEPPEDVVESYAVDPLTARVTAPWSVQARGTTAGIAWQVHTAPGELSGSRTDCRTFETDRGARPVEGGEPDQVAEAVVTLPNHAGHLAVCGSSTFGVAGMARPRPAVQVLPSWAPFEDDVDRPHLVAFAIDPRLPTDEIRLERVDGDPVTVAVGPGGVAVWDATASSPVTRVLISGGTVACAVARRSATAATEPTADGGGGSDPVESFLSELGGGLGRGLEPCVRVG